MYDIWKHSEGKKLLHKHSKKQVSSIIGQEFLYIQQHIPTNSKRRLGLGKITNLLNWILQLHVLLFLYISEESVKNDEVCGYRSSNLEEF